MALKINQTLAIRLGPFEKGIDLLILEKSEAYLRTQMRNPYLSLFSVNYKEEKSTKPGYRMFKVIEGFNQRDK